MSDSLWPYYVNTETGERLELITLASLHPDFDVLHIFKSIEGYLNSAYRNEDFGKNGVLRQISKAEAEKE